MVSTSLTSVSSARDYFKSHDRVTKYENPDKMVHSVGWNSEGRRLAYGGLEKTVGVASLDPSKGLRTEFTCKGHTDVVDRVTWHSSAPQLLASASSDKSARVWDVRSKKGIATITTKGQNINAAWSPDGKSLCLGDKEDRLAFVDTATWKVRHEEQLRCEVNEFAYSPSGDLLFVCCGGGQVAIFDAASMARILTLQAHPSQASCLSIAMDPNGRYFAVGAQDSLVSLWDLPRVTCLRAVERLDWPVRAVSASADGALLAAGSEDNCIDIAWLATGERVAEIRTDGECFAVAWHPQQPLLAYATAPDPAALSSRSSRDPPAMIRLFGHERR